MSWVSVWSKHSDRPQSSSAILLRSLSCAASTASKQRLEAQHVLVGLIKMVAAVLHAFQAYGKADDCASFIAEALAGKQSAVGQATAGIALFEVLCTHDSGLAHGDAKQDPLVLL